MTNIFRTLAGWDFERIDEKQKLLRAARLPESLATSGWADVPADAREALHSLAQRKSVDSMRFIVSIWSDDNTEADTQSIVFNEEWGSAEAEMDAFRMELMEMVSDGVIDRFQITQECATDLSKREFEKWLAGYKEAAA